MRQGNNAPRRFFFFDRISNARKIFSRVALAAGALVPSLGAGLWIMQDPAAVDPALGRAAVVAPMDAASRVYGALLVGIRRHAKPSSDDEPTQTASLGPSELPSLPMDVYDLNEAEAAALVSPRSGEPDAKPVATASLSKDESAPVPPTRPTDFGWLTSHRNKAREQTAPAQPELQQPRRRAAALSAPVPAGEPTLFEKFFGAPQERTPRAKSSVLAYAPQNGLLDDAPGVGVEAGGKIDRWTAVYDISAHTVYMPDGSRLEAHSGLGDKKDDPRFVHVRMRGATPPHVYDLTLREKLFHGVQALRLTPVDSRNHFGRTGLLAHTYMLGPRGDSNGCVVFRNYPAFLRAFLNGDVKRLAVVASRD
jgi:hypothetical protein